MAVRRLNPDQPPSFAFSADNLAWAQATIAKYPPGKEASAVLPVLWRAQEQHQGWLPEPAIRYVADMLGMAYIRVLEVATFYTMFQLAPVGSKAHVQVCGTTPCMLRGAEDLIKVCKSKINPEPHHLSEDGAFSWEEVECLGVCANAPMVQIYKDTYEDLTPELLENVLECFASGNPPKPGSQIGRTASCPEGGATTLTDPSLFDGSGVGDWQARLNGASDAGKDGAAAAKPEPRKTETPKAKPAAVAADTPATAGPQSSTKSDVALEERLPAAAKGNVALEAAQSAVLAATSTVQGKSDTDAGVEIDKTPGKKPELLSQPRQGKADDLTLIWGVAEKLQEQLNKMGIWHFEQIATWAPDEVEWFEASMKGFKGRVERDKWIEQCKKLAEGWRPESSAGERPKE